MSEPNQAPLGPPSDPAIRLLRRALTKVVAAWRGDAGYLVYELMLAAATLMRIEGLNATERKHAMDEIVTKVLSIQLRREQETKH
jgi:hypothetical protein